MNKRERAYNNTTAVKALEQVDEELAIKALSDPKLDGEELSEILTTSLMGHIVNKKSNKPMNLSNKVVMAGIVNRMQQLLGKEENE
jgi:hypothetical protein